MMISDSHAPQLLSPEDEEELLQFVKLTKVGPLEQPLLSSPSLQQLTKLDLFNCGLSTLPSCLPRALPNLKIAFLSNNKFEEMPAVIGACSHLEMVAFRSNGMKSIHPDALQPQLRWLILTDNLLAAMPNSIGKCTKLQKLMLSGNQLTEFPEALLASKDCVALELIRLGSNQIQSVPEDLSSSLPNLCWIGLSDNPCVQPHLEASEDNSGIQLQERCSLPVIDDLDESSDAIVLGQGAGGVTRRVWWREHYVAVKSFAGNNEMTSDGRPIQERMLSSLISTKVRCDSLVRVLGETSQNKSLVMEFLDGFKALAEPPSLSSCSRDVYSAEVELNWEQAETLLTGILDALTKLHEIGVCHGDVYGHNILYHIEDENDGKLSVRLTDFGAAFAYDKKAAYAKHVERIELRAFAVLVDEVRCYLLTEEAMLAKGDLLNALASTCRPTNIQDATFYRVFVWWKQQLLANLAKEFGKDLEE